MDITKQDLEDFDSFQERILSLQDNGCQSFWIASHHLITFGPFKRQLKSEYDHLLKKMLYVMTLLKKDQLLVAK